MKSYIYIHSWEFKAETDKEMFGNQPVPGRVYVASIDPVSLQVLISIPNGPHRAKGIGGIMVHNFQGDNDRWSYHFVEVNEKNISSLGLLDEDFRLIMQGIPESNPNEGIFDKAQDAEEPSENGRTKKPESTEKIGVDIVQEVLRQDSDDILSKTFKDIFDKIMGIEEGGLTDVRDTAISAMVKLEETDPDMFTAISEILQYIAESYSNDGDAEIFTQAMTLVGMNSAEATTTLMFNALTLISKYTLASKKGETPNVDLLKSAVFLICIEILQRKRNTENGN